MILEGFKEIGPRLDGGGMRFGSFRQVGLVQVTVIGMQASQLQVVRFRDPPTQGQGLLSRLDPGAMHPAIKVHEETSRPARPLKGSHHLRRIHRGREKNLRKTLLQLHKAIEIGADRLMGQQDVPPARFRRHLGLGYGGALELRDALGHLQLNHFRHLVSLDVGTQTRDLVVDHAYHAIKVGLDPIRKDQKRWRRDRLETREIANPWSIHEKRK